MAGDDDGLCDECLGSGESEDGEGNEYQCPSCGGTGSCVGDDFDDEDFADDDEFDDDYEDEEEDEED